MRAYDRSQPLIAIHTPKTAGISVRKIFEGWFGNNLLPHYYDEEAATMPPRRDLDSLHSESDPVCVYGHFNRLRGFGIEDYYPEVAQFVTILRDPIERATSAYFFIKHAGSKWKDQSRIPSDGLDQFLLGSTDSDFVHFPRAVSWDNYQELIDTMFVEIGVMEHLESSMQRIADRLGMPYVPNSLEWLNQSERNQQISDSVRERFREKHQLGYAVYDYVAARYRSSAAEQGTS